MSIPYVHNKSNQIFRLIVFILFLAVISLILISTVKADTVAQPQTPDVSTPSSPTVSSPASPSVSGAQAAASQPTVDAPQAQPAQQNQGGGLFGRRNNRQSQQNTTGQSASSDLDAARRQAAQAQAGASDDGTQAYTYRLDSPKVKDNYGAIVLKTIIIVALFIGALYFVMKWVQKKQGRDAKAEESIKLLSQLPVGPNRFVQVIEVGGKILIIGTTEHNINLINEVVDEDAIKSLRMSAAKSDAKPVTFMTLMDSVVDTVKNQFVPKDGKKAVSKPTQTQASANAPLNVVVDDETKPAESHSSFINSDFLFAQEERLKRLQRKGGSE